MQIFETLKLEKKMVQQINKISYLIQISNNNHIENSTDSEYGEWAGLFERGKKCLSKRVYTPFIRIGVQYEREKNRL